VLARFRRDPMVGNVLGLVALFVALGAGAYAAGLAPDSVRSKHIKDGQVKEADLRDNAVTGPKVADDSLTGSDILETSLDSLPPSGNAGGDLTGTYPDPDLGGGVVGSDELANGSVAPADLGSLPGARAWYPFTLGCTTEPVIPTATGTVVYYYFEDFDFGGLHLSDDCDSPNTARMVAPITGTYQVSAGIIWASNGSGERQLMLRSNGSQIFAAQKAPPLSGTQTIQNVSGLTRLSAGDYVEAVVYQSSGGDLSISPANDLRNFLAMNWVGP
jgi:hypothetical protein